MDKHEEFYAKLSHVNQRKLEIQKNGEIHFKKNFCTFDTETKDGLHGKLLYCWSLAYPNPSSGRYVKDKVLVLQDYENLDPLFEFFKERLKQINVKKKDSYLIIYVHNLGFDVRFLADYCIRHEIEMKPCLSGSKMVAFEIPELFVRFIDSVQFLYSSQELAEKDWDVETNLRKIDCSSIFKKPYEEWNEEEKIRVFNHNKNDVLALHAVMKKFRTAVMEICGVDVLTVFTIGSLAMKAYKTTIPKDKPIINPFIKFRRVNENELEYWIDMEKLYNKNTQTIEEFARESYFGGRNEVYDFNRMFNVAYVDKVSEYPDVMDKKFYPIGVPRHVFKDEKIRKAIFEEKKLGIIKCKFIPNKYLNFPVLPIKKFGKVCFTNEPNEGIYTSVEIVYAVNKGYTFEFEEALIYDEKDIIFHDYIQKMYEIKRTGKGGRKLAGKYLMNALYGKFGQALIRDEPVFHFDKDIKKLAQLFEEMELEGEFESRFSEEYQMYYFITTKESIMIRPYQNVVLSSFITAYGRLELLTEVHYCEENKIPVYYDDTDSVSIPIKKLSILKNDGQLNHDLGNWDIEEGYFAIQFLAPKAYVGCKKIIKNKNKVKNEFRRHIYVEEQELEKYYRKGWVRLGNYIYLIKLKGVERSALQQILKDITISPLLNILLDLPQNVNHVMDEIVNHLKDSLIKQMERYDTFKSSLRHGFMLRTRQINKHYSFEYSKRKVNVDLTTTAWS